MPEQVVKKLSKLQKFLKRQEKPLRETNKIAIRMLDCIELPVFVKEMLSYGPRHPVKDKFNEIHFLVDNKLYIIIMDNNRLFQSVPKKGTSGEKLCEIE